MQNKMSELGGGLKLLFFGACLNLLTMLGDVLGLAALVVSFMLTAAGLMMALRVEKKYWIPLVLLAVNTFGPQLLQQLMDTAGMALALSAGSSLLSALVICLICVITIPWVEQRDEELTRRGKLAWQCSALSVLVAVSVMLMENVPGEQAQMLRGSLNIMALVVMAISALLYLSFLWKASATLQGRQ